MRLDSATDPFRRAEIAFFLGKAYLMQDDAPAARQWLETALAHNVTDYREEARKIIEKLKIEN